MDAPNHDFMFNFILQILTMALGGGRDIKCVRAEMEEAKLSLFADNMLVYTEHLKSLREFRKPTEYKIQVQKSLRVSSTWSRAVAEMLHFSIREIIR